MPKLQKIPRVGEQSQKSIIKRPPLSELSKLTPRPCLSALPDITKRTYSGESCSQRSPVHNSPPHKSPRTSPVQKCASGEGKSLVGAVTSWLPHNAKIVNSIPEASSMSETSGPQMVEYLAGRKFLIIPKHNLLSVSPSVAATALSTSNADKNSDAPETSLPVDSASLGPVSLPEVKTEPESPTKPVSSEHPEGLETNQVPDSGDFTDMGVEQDSSQVTTDANNPE